MSGRQYFDHGVLSIATALTGTRLIRHACFCWCTMRSVERLVLVRRLPLEHSSADDDLPCANSLGRLFKGVGEEGREGERYPRKAGRPPCMKGTS